MTKVPNPHDRKPANPDPIQRPLYGGWKQHGQVIFSEIVSAQTAL